MTARGRGFECHLPFARRCRDEVVIGVRPENLALEPRANAAAIDAAVELREVLGAEVLLHLRSEAGPLTVRADAHSPARQGDKLRLWIDESAMHVFDARSEQRL